MTKKKSFFTFLFIPACLVIIGFIAYSAIKENSRNRQIQKEIEALKQEAEKIKTTNQELQEKNQYFSTQDFQEKIAKEKLNLQKENENVVVVKPSPSSIVLGESKENNSEKKTTGPEIPNYKKWWNYFFGYKS